MQFVFSVTSVAMLLAALCSCEWPNAELEIAWNKAIVV